MILVRDYIRLNFIILIFLLLAKVHQFFNRKKKYPPSITSEFRAELLLIGFLLLLLLVGLAIQRLIVEIVLPAVLIADKHGCYMIPTVGLSCS